MSGLIADKLWIKVTNAPKQAGKMLIVPGQMGFKNKGRDGEVTWCNEWIDVRLVGELAANPPTKGDVILVDGNVGCQEYNGKKQWFVWADSFEYPSIRPEAGSSNVGQRREPDGENLTEDDSIPF